VATSPDTRSLTAALGPESPAIYPAIQHLESIYAESKSLAPVDNSYRFWVAGRPFDADTSPELFIRHTCLSLLCRLLAYRFLEPRPSDRDLWNVIGGDYFAGAGLGNFLGEDFFSWPFFRLSMGIGDDALSMETAKSLLTALETLDLDQPDTGLLSGLYREFQGIEDLETRKPDLALFEEHTSSTCIAPYCGDGASLSQAVRAALDSKLADGQIPPDALLDLTGQFLGMAADPLAATVASLSFLLSLGEEVTEPHAPLLIPVYLAHGAHPPTEQKDAVGNSSYVVESAGGVALPEEVAADPLYLDWLFGRLPNYQRGAALRLRAQPHDVALQEVLNAWYNYLTSPKARTPIPDPLSPRAADVMVEAARTLITQYVGGSGPGPLYLVRNAPAPLFASRRTFDFMLWPSDLDDAPELRQTCADRYLDNGRVVVV
jgi:hypothetical protein